MIRKILTPTDGSQTAQAATQFARDIALYEHAEVIVLGVAHAIQYGDTTAFDPIPQLMEDERGFVDAEVDLLTAAGVKATGRVECCEQPFETIVDIAEDEGVDLIVMGTHGRTGLARAVIGSVADRVIRHTQVPVVLVPKPL